MARCPKTAAEAFKRLDMRLSEEDKKAIRDAESMIEFHFSLGMWIRNYWIHTGEKENLAMLMRDMGEDVITIGEGDDMIYLLEPDGASQTILEAYQKHLKEK